MSPAFQHVPGELRNVGGSAGVPSGCSRGSGPSNGGFCGGTFGYYVCSPSHCVCVCAAARNLAAGVSSAGSGSVAAAAGNGRITIINQRGALTDRPMGISTIDRRGRLHVLKRCDAGTGWRGCLQPAERRLGSRWAPSRFLGHDDRRDQYLQRASRPQHPYGQGSSSPARWV